MAGKRIDFIVGAKDEASRKLGKIQGAVQSLGPAVIGVAAAWVSWQGATRLIDSTVGAAIRQEEIFKKLETAVNLTGQSYDSAKPQIDSFLRSMQDTTRYGDTDMAPALQQITQLTGDLSKGFEGSKLAADIASAGLFDLNTASRYVAMAMSGEVTMLGRYIPELKVSSGLINENMTATEKWAIAKDLLNQKFGGAAEKDLDTAAGQMARLKNELGDIGEAIGDTVLPALTTLVGTIADVARFFNGATAEAKDFRVALGEVSEETISIESLMHDYNVQLDEFIENFKEIKILTKEGSDDIAFFQENLAAYVDSINEKFDAQAIKIAAYNAEWKNLPPIIDENIEKANELMTEQEFFADSSEEALNRLADSWIQQEEGMRKMSKNWGKTTKDMSVEAQKLWSNMTATQRGAMNLMGQYIGQFTDNMVDRLFEGGISAREIFENMAKDFMKYFIKAALAALINQFLPGLGSILGGIFDTYKNDMMAYTQGTHFAGWFIQGANDAFRNNPWGPQIGGALAGNLIGSGAMMLPVNRNFGMANNSMTINIYGDNYDETIMLKKIERAAATGRSQISLSRDYYSGEY